MPNRPRLLILGAHPDDAEFHGGGLAAIYRELDRPVKLVSVTDGSAGHHERTRDELIPLRRAEAANAGAVIGATYETWDFTDGELEPTLDVRRRIIREIREFQPDLVLTHRICDYHPDHRAVGQCVQDASYMVTVPLVVPEVPALKNDPVVAFLPDLFTRPTPLRPDVVIDIAPYMKSISQMLACHQTQLFEWLAYEADVLHTVPNDQAAKEAWVLEWAKRYIGPRRERFREFLTAKAGAEQMSSLQFIEAFEISEYARQPDEDALKTLFPNAFFPSSVE
ncbi:PIG-L deacetylase family protein [Fuerstiella marisgermanici]|uniref:4-oxalmesaconate hydratase n=1 Tax=Fuerstiella marisgermanici TaxID=1891926 RepID=A0A1P8WJ37_9PLAN|nr:PIG-L family deacetylase [Fuerstiella marisgermanici]APZ94047.1 4-oxalmesaconate hydratase [Fuerstiella marisgermanici]